MAWLSVGAAVAAPVAPVTCAIRWDAWYTNGANDPGAATAKALSKPEWRSRTPLHASFDAAGRVAWSSTQKTFDAEIRAAKQADLCWAYLAYGRDGKIDLSTPMMRGLAYQRTSAIKAEVPYALMLQADVLGKTGDYRDAVGAILELMRDSNYERIAVEGRARPLLLFFYDDGVKSRFGGKVANLRGPFDLIRQRSREQGLGDPYIVVLAFSGPQAEQIRKTIGAEAISRYVGGERAGHVMAWARYEDSIEREWDGYAAATRADVAPILTTGADIRARCETPPPWDHGRFPQGKPCDNYAVDPSTRELKTEFRNALLWLQRHRDKDPANLLLVYSWSECDESGNCLMPTYGDPDGEKIRAIAEALRGQR